MSNQGVSEERVRSWVTAMVAGFGWEVDRQAKELNKEVLKDRLLTTDNHPTSANSVWRCGTGLGSYFLDNERGTVGMKTCADSQDFDNVEGEQFSAEVRIREDRGAEVLFVDETNSDRVLTSSELASHFVDRLRDKDQS